MLTWAVSDGRCSGRRRPWKVLDDDEWRWSKPIVDPPQLIVRSGKLLEQCWASGTDILSLSHHLQPVIAALVMEVMEVMEVVVAWCTLQYHQIYLADLSFLLCFLNVQAGDNDVTMTKWISVGLTSLTRSRDTNKAWDKYLLLQGRAWSVVFVFDRWVGWRYCVSNHQETSLPQAADGAELRPCQLMLLLLKD